MRKIPVAALKPGMKVARPIYGSSGYVLIQQNVVLSRRYIEQLRQLGVPSLYIDDGLLDGYQIDDVVTDVTRMNAISRVRDLVTDLEQPNPASRIMLRTKEVARNVDQIVSELMSQPDLMVNLIDIRLEDDYLFGHSVNVCVLSLITGISAGLNNKQLVHLGVGAILHDVGKGVLPRNILYKPGPLTNTEFSVVKTHTSEGYSILRDMTHARDVAHEHHERYDGSGYPNGKKGDAISYNAQIASVCDVFDAVTSDRVYRAAYPIHEAVELIAGSGNQAFSLTLIQKFLENIAAYPTGSIIELSDGRIGIVIDTPRGFCQYPRVKLLYDQDTQPVTTPIEVHTLDDPSLIVKRVLPEQEIAKLRASRAR
ncbi:MAG: metal dependent phosphohydrolase [Bacillota bacterium]|nr:MAG: metal dependent phosphohydrolase [Bacillota bacterium]